MTTKEIRTRFAPSPTGYVHVGSVRTALYNYLYAKKLGGTYVLRIEDTDQNRMVEGSVENLVSVMESLNIPHQEGPGKEGDYGPYFQSERLSLYQDSIGKLLHEDKAYPCFCTKERLESMRAHQEEHNLPPGYDGHCRNLSKEEGEKRMGSEEYVIRMRIPESGEVKLNDMVRGEVSFPVNTIDDQVLMKADGFPTYHLANVIDDHHMKISHVIRGEEWLPSTPKHILLYQAFGWEPPEFAHLPLILNPDRTKLSKRQGDVSAEDFLNAGILHEALVNFLALLGWNPGNDEEIFSLDSLVENFDLSRVSKAGAVLDREKLAWMNGQYLKGIISEEAYLKLVREELSPDISDRFDPKAMDLLLLNMRKYLDKPSDCLDYFPIYVTDPEDYDWQDEGVQEILKMETNPTLYEAFLTKMNELETLNQEDFRSMIKSVQKETKIKGKSLYMPLRVAMTGRTSGPEYFIFPEVFSLENLKNRLKIALEKTRT